MLLKTKKTVYFTDASDFVSVTMTVTFQPGESTASVSVSIVNDSNIEATEMFSATLTAVSNVVIDIDDTAIVTILDDDCESMGVLFCKRIILIKSSITILLCLQ